MRKYHIRHGNIKQMNFVNCANLKARAGLTQDCLKLWFGSDKLRIKGNNTSIIHPR